MQQITILRYDLTPEFLRIVYSISGAENLSKLSDTWPVYAYEEKIFFADLQTYKPLLLKLGIVQGYTLDEDDNTICLVKNDMGEVIPWALADLDLNPAQLMLVVEAHEQQHWTDKYKSVEVGQSDYPFTDEAGPIAPKAFLALKTQPPCAE